MLDWDYQLDIIREDSKDSTGAINAHKISIVSLNDGEILTSIDQNHTFKISQEEANIISNVFKIKDFDTFIKDGINIENINYKFINSPNDEMVFGKKEDLGTLTIQKTKTKIIIGFTQDGYQQSGTNKALKNIARYFEKIKI